MHDGESEPDDDRRRLARVPRFVSSKIARFALGAIIAAQCSACGGDDSGDTVSVGGKDAGTGGATGGTTATGGSAGTPSGGSAGLGGSSGAAGSCQALLPATTVVDPKSASEIAIVN